jgi:diguanylate cyclase (GGDEF)-like protein
MNSLSLRTTLVVVFSVIALLLSTILSITIGNTATSKVEEEIGQSLAGISYQMAEQLDQFMWSRSGETDIISQLSLMQDNTNAADIQAVLDQLASSFPSFTWVGYLNAEGKVIASTNKILLGENISQRPVYIEGMKGKFIGDVHDALLLSKLLPNPSGEPLQFVDISTPVKNDHGEVVGVLAAHLSWEWSREVEASIIEPLVANHKGLEVFVVSQNDNTILLGPEGTALQSLNLDSVKLAQSGKNGWRIEKWADGQSYLTGYSLGDGHLNYPGLGWSVVIRQPVVSAFSSVEELRSSIFMLAVGATVVFALIGWFLAARLSNPLRKIALAADQLRAGDNVQIPDVRGFKDIIVLSRSLRDLLDHLNKTESALDEMENLANTDKLTGLSNRIALDPFLEEATERAFEQDTTLTFLFLDLDGFKQINDTYGHLEGDHLLKEVARRLTKHARQEDFVARMGGDEFLIVLPTGKDTAQQEGGRIAERLIAEVNKPYQLQEGSVSIGCSIGGAIYPTNGDEPIEIIRLADEGLYRSKRSGKNQVTFI